MTLETVPSDGAVDEPRVRRVAVHICENCINGEPGECHVPLCLFIWRNIEETPQPLRYQVEFLDETPASGVLR